MYDYRINFSFFIKCCNKIYSIKFLWNFILVEYFGLQSLNNIHTLILLVVYYLLTLNIKFKVER